MPIDIRGIKSAMFNTPKNYKESSDYYKKNLQYKIDETYQYAPDTFEIGQEIIVGSMNFTPVVCRVCHAIEPKTGLNLGDDFKDLKFFDTFGDNRIMGQRYRFDESVWITTNTDNLHYVTRSAIVRRCNNTLNFINKHGDIVNEPCIVGYAMKYANIYYNDNVEIPQGTISVTVQANSNTEWISVNDRFLLNNTPYKVKVVKNYLRNLTNIAKSNPIIDMELFVDSIAPDDDFSIGVANMNKYSSMYPKREIKANGIVITPNTLNIYKGQRITFECYNYIDGIKQSDKFTFKAFGASELNRNFAIVDGNTFIVTCLGFDETPLIIECSNGKISYDYRVSLRGLY